jgi:hypothetical protein
MILHTRERIHPSCGTRRFVQYISINSSRKGTTYHILHKKEHGNEESTERKKYTSPDSKTVEARENTVKTIRKEKKVKVRYNKNQLHENALRLDNNTVYFER